MGYIPASFFLLVDRFYCYLDRFVRVGFSGASRRIATPVVLLDSLSCAEKTRDEATTRFAAGPPPVFLVVSDDNDKDRAAIETIATRLAESFSSIMLRVESNSDDEHAEQSKRSRFR